MYNKLKGYLSVILFACIKKLGLVSLSHQENHVSDAAKTKDS